MAIGLTSKSNTYTPLYLSNYAYTQIDDSLKRIDGVGYVMVWGAQPYSMRVWLNPDLMFSRGLTADDLSIWESLVMERWFAGYYESADWC
jgi:multidrug efflux pump subunit AcrB